MKDKAIIELVIVLIVVGFALWSLYKDKNSTPVTGDNAVKDQQVAPNPTK